MIFCATALERTRTIKLGTGVLSVPYHNPLWTADRVVQLDHLSRGRFMFGVGPGALPTDAAMIGIQPSEQRRMLEEGMDAIVHLLRSDEPLTMETDWFDLRNAKVPAAPATRDIEMAVAAIASPSGPRIAGKHGIGLLSIGATMQIGADVLALHYDVWRRSAEANGNTAPTATTGAWSGLMHIAETREQAMRGCRVRHRALVRLPAAHRGRARTSCPRATPSRSASTGSTRPGIGAIGTAEDCVAQIERLWKQSTAASAATCAWTRLRQPPAKAAATSCIAQRVMPHFQSNTFARLQDAVDAGP